MDSGTRITGGGSGYAAIWRTREASEFCTVELGSVTLKRIGFFCFPIKHSTHTALVCVYYCSVCLLLQDLLQSCSRGGRRRVEDMCYERRRADACVDESAHHALVNAGGREIV
jgi:hypothetical protein